MRTNLCVSIMLLTLTGCSLYESSGRKIIETNQNNIVGAFGFNSSHTLQYECSASRQPPEFLSAPLDAVATPYEADGMTVLIDEHAHPAYLAIEKAGPADTYLSCKVKFIKSGFAKSDLNPVEISEAARLGHGQIIALGSALSRGCHVAHCF